MKKAPVIFGVVASAVLSAPPVSAQIPTAAPPGSPDAACIRVGMLSQGVFTEKQMFAPGDGLAISGQAQCAPGEEEVVVELGTQPSSSVIARTAAAEDGSYLIEGQLPNPLGEGVHALAVRTPAKTYNAQITVGASAVPPPSPVATVQPTPIGVAPNPAAGSTSLFQSLSTPILLLVIVALFVLAPTMVAILRRQRRRARSARRPRAGPPHLGATAWDWGGSLARRAKPEPKDDRRREETPAEYPGAETFGEEFAPSVDPKEPGREGWKPTIQPRDD